MGGRESWSEVGLGISLTFKVNDQYEIWVYTAKMAHTHGHRTDRCSPYWDHFDNGNVVSESKSRRFFSYYKCKILLYAVFALYSSGPTSD